MNVSPEQFAARLMTGLTARSAAGLSWLSAIAGILLFALLSLLLNLVIPAQTAHFALVVNLLATVLAVVLAPLLLHVFDQMQQRVARQAGELRSLHAIDRAINATLDLQTILDISIREVTLAVDAEWGALWLLDEDAPWPRPLASAFCNLSSGMQQALTERLGTGLSDLARRTGEVQRGDGLEETWKTDRAAAGLRMRSLIAVPIRHGDVVVGVALAGNRGGTASVLDGFSDDDVQLLSDIAVTVSVAVQHAQMYQDTLRRDEILRGLIARTGDAIAASSDARLLMLILADEAARILPCRRVAVYACAEDSAGADPNLFLPLAAHDDTAARDESGQSRALLDDFFSLPLTLNAEVLSGTGSYVPALDTALGLPAPAPAFLGWPGYLFPLRSRDRRVLGLLCLLDPAPRLRSSESNGFARALAAQASVALENARLAQKTQVLLARSQALQEAAGRFAAELDADRVLEGVAGSARRVLDADGYALWGYDAATGDWRSRAAEGLRPDSGDPEPGQPALLTRVLQARQAQVETDLPPGPVRAVLALPLLYAGRATGALSLYYPTPRAFTPDEIGLAQSFADQAAVALENARLFADLRLSYDRQRRIAETLQESLLPTVPDRAGSFEFGHKYQAALDEAVIGGDFYDLFPLGPHMMGLVMADVSGKGLKAAVQTAMLKYTLRGFALESPASPAQVLARVNDVLCSPLSSHDGFVTLFYGVLDTQTGDLTYANAGHEPPLRRTLESGETHPLPSSDGLALGALGGVPYSECTVRLHPGDLLLLYTDGLTEARAEDGEFLSMDGLTALFPAQDLSAPAAVEHIYGQVAAFAGDVRRDDVALLALRRLPALLLALLLVFVAGCSAKDPETKTPVFHVGTPTNRSTVNSWEMNNDPAHTQPGVYGGKPVTLPPAPPRRGFAPGTPLAEAIAAAWDRASVPTQYLSVLTDGGKVRLLGSVAIADQKRRAEQLARAAAGVTHLESKIVVLPNS